MDEFFLMLDDCLTAIEKVVGYILKRAAFSFLMMIACYDTKGGLDGLYSEYSSAGDPRIDVS